MRDPRRSIFYGMTTAQLQAALASAQQAYIALSTGTKGVSFSYTQGDGTKSVTYAQTDTMRLVAMIDELKELLGIVRRSRRPMRFWYA